MKAMKIITINNVEVKDEVVQLGFKVPLVMKKIFKGRAGTNNTDMQTVFEKMLNEIFEKEPLTNVEKELIEETKKLNN